MWVKFKRWFAHLLFGRQVVFLDRIGYGYQETDVMLEESCRQLLINYVEVEQGGFVDDVPSQYTGYLESGLCNDLEREVILSQIEKEMQIFELYKWFKYEQPRLQMRLWEMSGQVPVETMIRMENQYNQELTDRLKELIDLRGYLWT